jgi:hypothetical protein
VSIGIDNYYGVAAKQSAGCHLSLIWVTGRNEVRSIGIASRELLVIDASENLRSGRVNVGLMIHDLRHCLTISTASALAFVIAAAIAALGEGKSRTTGACLPLAWMY